MPSIHLTNNTSLDINASSADGGATLNRYLRSPLTFVTPAGRASIIDQKVTDLDPRAFPITANAGGSGEFAMESTTLAVQLGASASLGLIEGDDLAYFLGLIDVPVDPAVVGLVSFEFQGTLGAGDSATIGDFTLGISKNATVSLSSYCNASSADTAASAFTRAIAGLTIPRDIADLHSLPLNSICQVDAASSLQFAASVTYSFLNDPLASLSIAKLPSLSLNATAGATLEGTVTHTSDHTVTLAKLPSGFVRLAVSLTKTDDFETSLTVSAGVQGGVGSFDALAFLLDQISPNSFAEMTQIRADLPAANAELLSIDIKAALDAALGSSLGLSLKAALDASKSKDRIFLFEIDLAALDEASSAALQSALRGNFTGLTRAGAVLAGIRQVDSVLVTTSQVTHSMALHLLGILNYGSTSTFIEESKVDYTKDTHEIILSDERIQLATNNLDAEKLREVMVKGLTLTLPASANTPEAAIPIHMLFFDRQAAASPSMMRQFVNVLQMTGAASAATAGALFARNLKNYGDCSLYLGLNLTPAQAKQLFLKSNGAPLDQSAYIQAACGAEAIILAGDGDNADRLRLFTAGAEFWQQISDEGSAPNVIPLLTARGIRENAYADVVTVLWWSSAMAAYSDALAHNKPLEAVGKEVVKDATLGFPEPWLVVAAWTMLGKPAIESIFTSSLLKPAATSPGAVHAAGSNP